MVLVSHREIKKNRVDWTLIGTVFMLILIGTIAIVSATSGLPLHDRLIRTHFIAIPAAILFFILGLGLNYQVFQDQWKMLYGIVIAALLGVLIFGMADRGSKSWYHLPFFSIQPSEMCRVGLILILANYLDKRAWKVKELSTIIGALALVAPVFLLIIKQPDFSAILITFPTVLGMLFCAGANMFHLSVIAGYGFLSALFPVLWTLIAVNSEWMQGSKIISVFYGLSHFGWPTIFVCVFFAVLAYSAWWISVQFRYYFSGTYFVGAALVVMLGFVSGILVQHQMKDYQRKRFEVFLSPESDPKGAGYNLLQAKIAIGSGGILGKGIFSGTQSRLGFVPERHTDFIIAVIGEELGFMGTISVLGLYLVMMWRVIVAARASRDQFGYLVSCGILSMFMVYLLINYGMSVGLVPVAGIPLPLLSYGGSNLVATMWALGIVQSVYSRRYALL